MNILKDERRTSNIERRTSNNDVAFSRRPPQADYGEVCPLLKLFQHRMKKQTPNEKQRFRVQGYLVAVFPTSDFWLLTSVSSSFPIQHSMPVESLKVERLDVRPAATGASTTGVRCSSFFSPSWPPLEGYPVKCFSSGEQRRLESISPSPWGRFVYPLLFQAHQR